MHGVDSSFVRLDVRFLGKSPRLRTGKEPSALRLSVLTAAIAVSMTFGCGTTHAILEFTAPPTATAGSPFTVTVAVKVDGKRDTIINGGIHFTSSDPAAVLPADYGFTPADAGSHTWTNGFILMTPGNQTISASIADIPGINGGVNVTVSPGARRHPSTMAARLPGGDSSQHTSSLPAAMRSPASALLICSHQKAILVADVAELFDMLNGFSVWNVGLTRTQSPRTETEGN